MKIGAVEAARRLSISRRRVLQLATEDRKAGPERLHGRRSVIGGRQAPWEFTDVEVERFRAVLRPQGRPAAQA